MPSTSSRPAGNASSRKDSMQPSAASPRLPLPPDRLRRVVQSEAARPRLFRGSRRPRSPEKQLLADKASHSASDFHMSVHRLLKKETQAPSKLILTNSPQNRNVAFVDCMEEMPKVYAPVRTMSSIRSSAWTKPAANLLPTSRNRCPESVASPCALSMNTPARPRLSCSRK